MNIFIISGSVIIFNIIIIIIIIIIINYLLTESEVSTANIKLMQQHSRLISISFMAYSLKTTITPRKLEHLGIFDCA